MIILIDINDILVTGGGKDLIDKAIQTLHNNFKVKDLGKLKYFLVIEVLRSQKVILLNSKEVCPRIGVKYGIKWCKTSVHTS